VDELRQVSESDMRLIAPRQGSVAQKEARQFQFLELLADAPTQRHALEQMGISSGNLDGDLVREPI